MATRKMAPSPVRAVRSLLSLAMVAALATASGCAHHKRTSMRPVYGAPVVTSPAVVVPASPAGGTIVPGPAMPSGPGSGMGVEPELSPIGSGNGPDGVSRTSTSPPVPAEAEPRLSIPESPPTANPNGAGAGPSNPAGSNNVDLIKPSAMRTPGRSASVPTSVKVNASRVGLREAVQPFVAEPDDLFQPPRADRPWKYIVVHHSDNAAGGLDQIDRDHRKILGFEGCGYHFVIGNGTESPDGRIEVANRWLDQKNGVHCRNGRNPEVNEYGIGICLVGNLDQSGPTAKQVAAAHALVAYLAARYQIPADRVGSHAQFADGPTACPGKYFPSREIFGTSPMAAR